MTSPLRPSNETQVSVASQHRAHHDTRFTILSSGHRRQRPELSVWSAKTHEDVNNEINPYHQFHCYKFHFSYCRKSKPKFEICSGLNTLKVEPPCLHTCHQNGFPGSGSSQSAPQGGTARRVILSPGHSPGHHTISHSALSPPSSLAGQGMTSDLTASRFPGFEEQLPRYEVQNMKRIAQPPEVLSPGHRATASLAHPEDA